jgi:hypothetical protein
MVNCDRAGYALAYGGESNLSLPEFLDWLADRMIYVYNESPNIDFVQSCRVRAMLCRDALEIEDFETKVRIKNNAGNLCEAYIIGTHEGYLCGDHEARMLIDQTVRWLNNNPGKIGFTRYRLDESKINIVKFADHKREYIPGCCLEIV